LDGWAPAVGLSVNPIAGSDTNAPIMSIMTASNASASDGAIAARNWTACELIWLNALTRSLMAALSPAFLVAVSGIAARKSAAQSQKFVVRIAL
jgi:hypothetical protein